MDFYPWINNLINTKQITKKEISVLLKRNYTTTCQAFKNETFLYAEKMFLIDQLTPKTDAQKTFEQILKPLLDPLKLEIKTLKHQLQELKDSYLEARMNNTQLEAQKQNIRSNNQETA